MSKILKNDSGSNIIIGDTGITINNATQYTIPPNDYLLWAASSDVITEVGAGNLVVNDGSIDLSISEGTDLIKGLFPKEIKTINRKEDRDSFGRLRTSNLINLFDYDFVYDDDLSSYWDTETANGGTVAQNNTTSQFDLAITSTLGSRSVIQTRRKMRYFAGKSHLFYFTANPNSIQVGIRKRLGLFDENNGWFYEANGTAISVVVRSNASGSVVDNKIAIADWNVDKLDGNGPSGYNAATDNPNGPFNSVILFWLDISWLGSGGIRFGFYNEGVRYILHEEFYANMLTVPFVKSAHLPFRVEVEALAGATTGDSVSITCCSYQLEGNVPLLGKTQKLDLGPNEVTVGTTEQVFLGFRLKPTRLYSSSEITSTTITVNSGNSTVYWKLLYNATLTGALWSDKINSASQFINNATSVTFNGGKLLASGYVGVDDKGKVELDTDIELGFSISGIPDNVILVAQTISSNSKISAGATWKEFY